MEGDAEEGMGSMGQFHVTLIPHPPQVGLDFFRWMQPMGCRFSSPVVDDNILHLLCCSNSDNSEFMLRFLPLRFVEEKRILSFALIIFKVK